ncbi:MAG: tetratricopeptide repeat protein [Acidobacteria bacterium]|nr:tetratricopeptide repeat protein [Candidatus Sulfomarinibacter kjeldsenii]
MDEAVAVAARASAAAPWSLQALVTEADAEIHRGRYQRALDLLDRALELNDRFWEARLERSRCLASLGRNDEAVAELESLLEASPDNNWVALRYAEIVELGSGDYNAAERRLRTVISRNPSFAQAWLLLGTVLTRAGRASDAVSVYREAIASGVADLDLLDRALELNDHFLEARLERSRCLASLGRNDEAVAELEPLLEASPDNNWVALRYAEFVELASGDYNAAERRLRTVISRNPSFAQAWLLLGTVLTHAGRASDAVSVYREAIASGAVDSDLPARLALLLAEASDPAAETALREAIRSSPAVRADLHLALGELLSAQGRRDEARHQFEIAGAAPAAIAREPTAAGAWNNLGIALEELGRTQEAETAYRRAGEIDTRDSRALFNLGILLRTSSRYEEAAIVQQEVLARNPAHSGAHFELGMLYAGFLGDIERAKVHLQATIDADPNHPRAKQARFVLDQLP